MHFEKKIEEIRGGNHWFASFPRRFEEMQGGKLKSSRFEEFWGAVGTLKNCVEEFCRRKFIIITGTKVVFFETFCNKTLHNVIRVI